MILNSTTKISSLPIQYVRGMENAPTRASTRAATLAKDFGDLERTIDRVARGVQGDSTPLANMTQNSSARCTAAVRLESEEEDVYEDIDSDDSAHRGGQQQRYNIKNLPIA